MDRDKTLVVGDVHVRPGQKMTRATLLGKHIQEVQPDRVVFIGDFLDFDSLSAWDRNKRLKMEGRRYQKDIDAGKKFLSIMYKEIPDSLPDFIFIEGNHEHRLARYLETDPTFEGSVDYIRDLQLEDWEFVPYKSDWNYRGVSFTHVPINENGNPVGGKYPTARSLDLYTNSVVFGHTHKLKVDSVHRKNGKHLQQAVNVGCFFDFIPEYAKGSQTSYWKGLVELDHYGTGRFGIDATPMGLLKRKYK